MRLSSSFMRLLQGNAGRDRIPWRMAAAAALALAISAPATVSAIGFADPIGDFLLPGYTGPLNSDVDIVSGSATYTPGHVQLSLTLNGAIGSTTATPYYFFGVNRGSGTDRFQDTEPPIGPPTILYDAIVRFDYDGNGRVVTFASATSPPVITLLFVHGISGSTVSADIPWSALPSTGFTPAQYTYISWSRSELGSHEFVADLAPDDASILAVPEPANWALMLVGLLATGIAARTLRNERLGEPMPGPSSP